MFIPSHFDLSLIFSWNQTHMVISLIYFLNVLISSASLSSTLISNDYVIINIFVYKYVWNGHLYFFQSIISTLSIKAWMLGNIRILNISWLCFLPWEMLVTWNQNIIIDLIWISIGNTRVHKTVDVVMMIQILCAICAPSNVLNSLC